MSCDETKAPDVPSRASDAAVLSSVEVRRELQGWGVPASRSRTLLAGEGERLDFAGFTRVLERVASLPYPVIPMLPGEAPESYLGRVRTDKRRCLHRWFRRIRKRSTAGN